MNKKQLEKLISLDEYFKNLEKDKLYKWHYFWAGIELKFHLVSFKIVRFILRRTLKLYFYLVGSTPDEYFDDISRVIKKL